jgi:hypothetical protein
VQLHSIKTHHTCHLQRSIWPQVDAPGTKVVSTPQGTVVTAPGTTAVGNKDGAVVNAPGTTVRTDKQAGTTAVRAPGTTVDVTPQGTLVTAPFVGQILVPNRNGRKMLRA